jgi:hypothetical protein
MLGRYPIIKVFTPLDPPPFVFAALCANTFICNGAIATAIIITAAKVIVTFYYFDFFINKEEIQGLLDITALNITATKHAINESCAHI